MLKKQLQAAGVHIRDGAMESILETSRFMREQGKENFLVRKNGKKTAKTILTVVKYTLYRLLLTLI